MGLIFLGSGAVDRVWAGPNGHDVEAVEPSFEQIQVILGVPRFEESLLVWPVAGQHKISSGFGYRPHPFGGKKSLHRGLDIAARRGTPIVAIAPGTVKFAGYRRGFGRMVQVQHSSHWISTYAHASSTVVKTGQPVLAGQLIAKVGSTGSATGPHLHLEIHRSGRPVDPLPLLREKLVVMTP